MPATLPSLTVLNAFHNERDVAFHKNIFPDIYLDVSLELDNPSLSVPSVSSVYRELELKLNLSEGETLNQSKFSYSDLLIADVTTKESKRHLVLMECNFVKQADTSTSCSKIPNSQSLEVGMESKVYITSQPFYAGSTTRNPVYYVLEETKEASPSYYISIFLNGMAPIRQNIEGMKSHDNRIFEFDGKLIISNGPNEFWNGIIVEGKLQFIKFSKAYFQLEEEICPVSIDSHSDFKQSSFVSYCHGSPNLYFYDYSGTTDAKTEQEIKKHNFSTALQNCPGCSFWKHIRVDSDTVLLVETEKKILVLFEKEGSIFSGKEIKMEGNMDLSAPDIKLEVLRDQAKLLFYNQKTAWIMELDLSATELKIKLQDFGIFNHKIKDIQHVDFEFIAQPSPATNHQIYIYGKDATEGSKKLVSLILDGRFHGKLKGLESQTLPSGNLKGKISVKRVGADAKNTETKSVASLFSIINYQAKSRLKLANKMETKLITQGVYTLEDYAKIEGSVSTPKVVKRSSTNADQYVLGNVEASDIQKIKIQTTPMQQGILQPSYNHIIKVGGTNLFSLEIATNTICLLHSNLQKLGECIVFEGHNLAFKKSSFTLMTQNYFVYLQPSDQNSTYMIAIFDQNGQTTPRVKYVKVEETGKPLRGLAGCSMGKDSDSFALMVQKHDKSVNSQFQLISIPATGTDLAFAAAGTQAIHYNASRDTIKCVQLENSAFFVPDIPEKRIGEIDAIKVTLNSNIENLKIRFSGGLEAYSIQDMLCDQFTGYSCAFLEVEADLVFRANASFSEGVLEFQKTQMHYMPENTEFEPKLESEILGMNSVAIQILVKMYQLDPKTGKYVIDKNGAPKIVRKTGVAQKKLEPRLGSLSESNPTMKVSKDSVYLLEPPDSKFSAFVFNIFKSYVQVSNSEIKESTIVFFIAPPALFDYKLVIGPGFTEEDQKNYALAFEERPSQQNFAVSEIFGISELVSSASPQQPPTNPTTEPSGTSTTTPTETESPSTTDTSTTPIVVPNTPTSSSSSTTGVKTDTASSSNSVIDDGWRPPIEPEEPKKSNTVLIVVIGLASLIAILAIIGGAVYYFMFYNAAGNAPSYKNNEIPLDAHDNVL